MLGFNVGQIGDPSVEGDEALTLQLMLLDRGIDLPQFGADGFAGDETRRGLAGFQNRHGIDEPGVVGPRTYAAFNRPANGGLSEAQVKDLANQQIAGSVLSPPDG